jgi:hypothetical protein
MAPLMTNVRFTREDLTLFSQASHDNSRLHMSDEYAKQTSYGEAIVFGILGVFASLGALAARPGKQLAVASIAYRVAFYMNVDYQIEVKERDADTVRALLKDGTRTMMTADFLFRDRHEAGAETEIPGVAPLQEQSTWTPGELHKGLKVSGCYAPAPGPLRALENRWKLHNKGATRPQIGVFLWSSFLTGMHLPGLLGTSAKLEVTYAPAATAAELPFNYDTEVQEYDDRFNLLVTKSELSGRTGAFATAEVSSHIRSAAP